MSAFPIIEPAPSPHPAHRPCPRWGAPNRKDIGMTTAERRCTCGHRAAYHQLAADAHWRRCTVCDCPDFMPAPLPVPAPTT